MDMKYVALLRGINVGGHTRVEMRKLKLVFEQAGCTRVSTYINSGNVVFSDTRSKAELHRVLEAAIFEAFDVEVPIVLRTQPEFSRLCEVIPTDWANDALQKTDVMFLWDEIDSKDILAKVKVNPQLERVKYTDGALVWNIDRENVTRGNGIKLIKTDLYRHMTVRNINTVRKLNELLLA